MGAESNCLFIKALLHTFSSYVFFVADKNIGYTKTAYIWSPPNKHTLGKDESQQQTKVQSTQYPQRQQTCSNCHRSNHKNIWGTYIQLKKISCII